MVNNIILLEDDRKYLILDETTLDNKNYCYGLRLDENEEPTASYLFFEVINENDRVYMNPINDDKLKGILLTAFAINYLNMAYDEM